MSKGGRASQVKMISIDRINILNPRVRSQKIFEGVASNIAQIGLKKPITVTICSSPASGKDYDLVCGQGRMEAYLACGQKEIPALIIEANEEQALIMSLVENLARRQHRATDLLHGIELLQKQGYNLKAIAEKTGLSQEYIGGVINLMKRGEERLLMAVESGHIPLSVAVKVAEAPDDEQHALQEAYEKKQLRGKKLLVAKRLIEKRKRLGKTIQGGRVGPRGRGSGAISAQDVLNVYQKEVDRKRHITRKAEIVGSRMLFVTEALGRLFKEDNFSNLLRAEGLVTLPKPLAELMTAKGIHVHG